jgi:hypothetical protein
VAAMHANNKIDAQSHKAQQPQCHSTTGRQEVSLLSIARETEKPESSLFRFVVSDFLFRVHQKSSTGDQ